MLSDKLVKDFKRIFKEEYNVDYSDVETKEAAENLVRFLELLIQIDQRNKRKAHENSKEV